MDPVLATKAREVFGLSADITPDDQLDNVVATKALALSAEVAALKANAAALDARVLALSADAPRRPDAANMTMFRDNFAMKRQLLEQRTNFTPATIDRLFKILTDQHGNPNTLALSAIGEGRIAGGEIIDWAIKFGSEQLVTHNAIPRNSTSLPMGLSGDPTGQEETQAQKDAARRMREGLNLSMSA